MVLGGRLFPAFPAGGLRRVTEHDKDPAQALADAQAALTITPMSVRARLAEAHAFEALHQTGAARASFAVALAQAEQIGKDWYPAQIAEAQQGLSASETNVAKR
ncbi:hypothetical protein Acid345_1257 [Candidatus Koribacter versatilis Ellin345]|uniref:Uncharacterized protein n=1 Tax=Koribacter versatilis (strain Ellin345) TaxID=204669 RepID=Q1IS91_KORVE|nr:hypothetical protein Acid345_1257 [Candidatus Koribacter versatilis Ellin345]